MTQLRLTELINVLATQKLPATLEGEDRVMTSVATLEEATPQQLSFLSNPKYGQALTETRAGAVVVKPGVDVPAGVSALRCEDPYAGITVAIVALHGYRQHPRWGVSEQATIDPAAQLGPDCHIAPGAYLDADVRLGARCTVYPGCYLARGAQLGDDCVLYPNVVVYDHCQLGSRVTVHAGSVIGEDGLGYAPVEKRWVKIPQVGRVVVGDDVEIGANCSIDRATLGQTEIGTGTKFGNAMVIGHGTRIGKHCLFVGQVGLAGSVTVRDHVTLAGQVGAAGHLEIGEGATVGAQAGIGGDVPPGATMLGSPATDIQVARRAMLGVYKLPELMQRVRKLERELAQLRDARGPEPSP